MILGVLLATSALAHPIGAGEGNMLADATHGDPGYAREVLNARSLDMPEYGPAWYIRDERWGFPSDGPSKGDGDSTSSWPGQAQAHLNAAPGPFQEADPLTAALQAMRPQRSQRSLAPASPHLAQPDRTAAAEPEEQMVTAIRELQRSVVDALAGAVDARKEGDGQVTFSLAGIEGFRYAAHGGEVSIAYGDTALTVAQQSARMAAGTANRDPPNRPAPHDEDSASEILQFIKEILQYPLVWLTLLLLGIVKVALLVDRHRTRKRTHRRRSGTGQPLQHTKAKPRRKRVRVRFRLKRTPAGADLQEH